MSLSVLAERGAAEPTWFHLSASSSYWGGSFTEVPAATTLSAQGPVQ